MKYPSKKDLWLTILVWASMLFSIGTGIYALMLDELGWFGNLFIVLLSVGLPLFVLWMWMSTYYVVTDASLIVKYGPFQKVIPLDSITSVKKSKNPLSSPALSLKRLEILYGKYDLVYISPENREAFLEMLTAKCPQANVEV